MVVKDSFKFYWEEPFENDSPHIKIEVLGFRKGEIKVKLTKSLLTIKAVKRARKTESGNGYYKEEAFASSFMKSLALPHKINPKDFTVEVRDGSVSLKRKNKKGVKA